MFEIGLEHKKSKIIEIMEFEEGEPEIYYSINYNMEKDITEVCAFEGSVVLFVLPGDSSLKEIDDNFSKTYKKLNPTIVKRLIKKGIITSTPLTPEEKSMFYFQSPTK